MNSTFVEGTAEGPATTAGEQPKANKKAGRAQRARDVAPGKRKSGKKASPAKKAPKGAKKAAQKPAASHEGSKVSTILELLKRPGGATTKELIKATGWQPHSVRGFLSGTLRKKMGLEVISVKGDDGERAYSFKA